MAKQHDGFIGQAGTSQQQASTKHQEYSGFIRVSKILLAENAGRLAENPGLTNQVST
jgi:hypothetical protein